MSIQKISLEHLLVQAERAVDDAEVYCKRQQQILADIKQRHVPSAAVAAQLVLDQAERILRKRRMDLSYLRTRQPPA
jgi:hypothetical protein